MSRVTQNPKGQQAALAYTIPVSASTDNVSVGAASNAGAAVVFTPAGTQAGSTGQGSPVLGGIFWSYAAPITAGRLTVADSSGNLLDIDIHAGSGQNFGYWPFSPPLASQIPTSALTVTLGAPGVTQATGKLSVQGWFVL